MRRSIDRSRSAAETLKLVAPIARAIGVTRLADVTGLDRAGLIVFQAIRPGARSLSVSQGKGLTAAAARVSALTEAIEFDRVEQVAPDSFGPATPREAEIWGRPSPAAEQEEAFDPQRARGWMDAVDLIGGESVRVPHGLITMDCTLPRAADLWPNTNGLASGNDREEALFFALCEAVERDSHARWMAATPAARRATAIDSATVDDRLCRWLIAKVTRGGLRCAIWDMSGAHGIAALGCAIIEPGAVETLRLPPAFGAGCHPRAGVALARAIWEAAQTRVALIAGSRDDLSPADYADPGGQRSGLIYATRDFGNGPQRPWAAVPDRPFATIAAGHDMLIRACRDAGCRTVAAIDLSRGDEPIAVVRVAVPAFGDHNRPSSLPALAA